MTQSLFLYFPTPHKRTICCNHSSSISFFVQGISEKPSFSAYNSYLQRFLRGIFTSLPKYTPQVNHEGNKGAEREQNSCYSHFLTGMKEK